MLLVGCSFNSFCILKVILTAAFVNSSSHLVKQRFGEDCTYSFLGQTKHRNESTNVHFVKFCKSCKSVYLTSALPCSDVSRSTTEKRSLFDCTAWPLEKLHRLIDAAACPSRVWDPAVFPGLWEGEFVFTTSLSVMDLGKGGDVSESYGDTLSKTLVMGSQKLLQCEVHQPLLLKERVGVPHLEHMELSQKVGMVQHLCTFCMSM